MTGAQRITQERTRQRSAARHGGEGFDTAHDDQHIGEQLATAAAVYALPERYRQPIMRYWRDELWPTGWEPKFDDVNPERRVRILEKAGALIAAEIDRLIRAYPSNFAQEDAG